MLRAASAGLALCYFFCARAPGGGRSSSRVEAWMGAHYLAQVLLLASADAAQVLVSAAPPTG